MTDAAKDGQRLRPRPWRNPRRPKRPESPCDGRNPLALRRPASSGESLAEPNARAMTDVPLELVQLRDDGGTLEASFVPGAGMLCCSLRHQGRSCLPRTPAWTPMRSGARRWACRCSIPGRTGSPSLTTASRAAGLSVPHDPDRIALDDNGLPIHGVIVDAWHGRWPRRLARRHGSLAATLSWDRSRPQLFEVFPFHHDVTTWRA